MKIYYDTLAFVQAIEMKCGTMTSATNKEFTIEVDTETHLITITDKGIRQSSVEGDSVQTPLHNMRVGRPLKTEQISLPQSQQKAVPNQLNVGLPKKK